MNEAADWVPDMQNERIGRRLRKAISEAGQTIVAAAAHVKVTPKTMQRWLAGETGIDATHLMRLYEWLGRNPSEIFEGELSGESGDEGTPHSATFPVNIYDVTASAGDGATPLEGATQSQMRFAEDFLRQLVHDPKQAALLRVSGDSMEPTIRSDDLVLIDKSQNKVREGIYVVQLEDMLFVKRIGRVGVREIELKSDNPAYGPMSIDHVKDKLTVIGRVVWAGKRVG